MHKPLNIVAGENIPYVTEAFYDLGNLRLLPGRAITSADLKDTHILLIRSITQVNKALLQDTPVEFVGSASAGTDHMDTDYLTSHGIGFCSAAGSNANSVAEYVMAALLLLTNESNFSLQGKTIGIVGVGNIGKLVKQKAEVLGMQPVLNDPFLCHSGQIDHRSLKETLACDVVTLHTPLTTNGPYPTYHLLNQHTFQHLTPSTVFINAARGEVVDSLSLLDAIRHKRIGPTIIDVWEREPAINWELFQAVTLGTPHIAGHSLDGKAQGTFMIYKALCQHLNRQPTWQPAQSLPSSSPPMLTTNSPSASDQELIHEIITQIYDIHLDFQRMQQLLQATPDQRPPLFDALRKNYPVRREFHHFPVKFSDRRDRLCYTLKNLGFPMLEEL